MPTKIIQIMKTIEIKFDDAILKAKGDFAQKIEHVFRNALQLTHHPVRIVQNYDTPSVPNWTINVHCCASCQPTFVHTTQQNEALWDFILNELAGKPTEPFSFEVQVPEKIWA